MKNLFITLYLIATTCAAYAQYPLPSTTVFGNLTVQDTVTFTGGYVPFSSNVLNLEGFGDFPFSGFGGAYGNGVFINGIGDLTAVGFPNHFWSAGYLSDSGISFVEVDTTGILLRTFNGFDYPDKAGAQLEMYRDTSISGYQVLFNLTSEAPHLGTAGLTSQISDNKHQVSLYSNPSVYDEANLSYLKVDTELVEIKTPTLYILSPDIEVIGDWNQVGFNNYPTFISGSGSGTNRISFIPYGGLNNSMDFYVTTIDTSGVVGTATLGLNPYLGFNAISQGLSGVPNRITVDTVGVYLIGGSDGTEAKVNSNGLVLPNKNSDPTGENGAMYYNTFSNTARIFENGAWRNQTFTDSSGTYTPTATSITNIASSTPRKSNWSKVGNIVTVSGSVTITTSAIGLTQLGLSLPIFSNFATIYEGAGNVIATGTTTHSGIVYSDVANDYVVIEFRHAGALGADDFRFTYSYEILE
jgi:hypothetical protein